MLKRGIWILSVCLLFSCSAGEYKQVCIKTIFGTVRIQLLNETPIHRDNFIKLAKEGYYNGLLFHRVIPGFMIQGGDPESRNCSPRKVLGAGGPGYKLDAEIGALHFRGALAAARNDDPKLRSFGSQFYIVQGKPVTDEILDQVEASFRFTYTPEQRERYKKEGGSPFLDRQYTVFGYVVDGMEMVDEMMKVERDEYDRPTTNLEMNVKISR